MSRAVLFALFAGSLLGQVAEFRVRDTAGLRRFGYPVRARFQSGGSTASLRLLESGKPVQAQFTSFDGGYTEVDFNVNLGPFETRDYRVETGSGPAVPAGLIVDETADTFHVRYPAELEFQVPKDLLGLLRAVRTTRASYLRGPSRGLVVNLAGDVEHRVGGNESSGGETRAKVMKRGPLAVLLRFESNEALRGGRGVKSVVEMEFPRAKSWVEVRWTVEDPNQRVAGLIAELDLLIEERPMLVDFGAGSAVYAALRAGQGATFTGEVAGSGGQSWRVDVAGNSYAAGAGPSEGWAHVMDLKRATAVAIADFARFAPVARDAIDVSPEGRLRIRRDFSGGREKSVTFWLHFVDMPVQVGAATSPQSMKQPPVVELK